MGIYQLTDRIIDPTRYPWGFAPLSSYALSFDGTDDYVSFGSNASLNLDTSFTYAFRLKTSTDGKVIYNARDGSSNSGTLTIHINSNKVRVGIHAVATIFSSTSNVTTNSWIHVALTRNSSNAWALYFDGSEEASATNSAKPSAWAAKYLGRGFYGYFNGLISDVRIYDAALSSSQIATLSAGGHISAGLAGYWPMNEGAGSTLTDLSGNDNTGTVYGASWIEL